MKDLLRYDKMVEAALRNVVRQALTTAAEDGLPGAHHFYVTFRTKYPGVDIPDYLKSQYPQEMTIVLEHQFWDLEVRDEDFSVALSFHNKQEKLTIPFEAVSAFADPSVKFGLQFQENAGEEPEETLVAPPPEPPKTAESPKPGEVVALDAFRKKST